MNFYRKNWYYVGGVLFVLLAFFMGLWGYRLVSHIQLIMIYSFLALLVHQFEEYALPGGFPALFNVVMNGEKETPDRFPQNSHLAMVVNVWLAYPLYLAAIIFPNTIWLGITIMFFGFFQLLMHGIMINAKTKSWYTLGCATGLLLFLPIGIYYIWYVVTNGIIVPLDYLYGIIGTVLAGILTVAIPVSMFSTRNAKYPFSQAEMERGGMLEKAKQLDGSQAFNLFKDKKTKK